MSNLDLKMIVESQLNIEMSIEEINRKIKELEGRLNESRLTVSVENLEAVKLFTDRIKEFNAVNPPKCLSELSKAMISTTDFQYSISLLNAVASRITEEIKQQKLNEYPPNEKDKKSTAYQKILEGLNILCQIVGLVFPSSITIGEVNNTNNVKHIEYNIEININIEDENDYDEEYFSELVRQELRNIGK